MKPSMDRGDAMATRMFRHKSGVVASSQNTCQVLAIRNGTHVTIKQPVVSATTLIAVHLLGPFDCCAPPLGFVIVVVVVVAVPFTTPPPLQHLFCFSLDLQKYNFV